MVTQKQDLDLASAPALKDELLNAIKGGHRHIVVDLSGIQFIDSVGLGVLVGVMKQLRPDGGIAVVCPNERMRSTFEATGLDDLLNVSDTYDEAVAALAPV